MRIERKIEEILDKLLNAWTMEDEQSKGIGKMTYEDAVKELLALLTPKDTEEIRKEFDKAFPEVGGRVEDELGELVGWVCWNEEIFDFFAPYLKDTKAIEENAVRDYISWHIDTVFGKGNDSIKEMYLEQAKEYLTQKEKE